jgi:hypothetical protein
MPLPLRVSDLPRGVQNKIIAGTVAEGAPHHCLRARVAPAGAWTHHHRF